MRRKLLGGKKPAAKSSVKATKTPPAAGELASAAAAVAGDGRDGGRDGSSCGSCGVGDGGEFFSARELFDQIDANGDGFLSLEELLPLVGRLLDGASASAAERQRLATELLHTCDKNSDGRIDREEFAAWYSAQRESAAVPSQPQDASGGSAAAAPSAGAGDADAEVVSGQRVQIVGGLTFNSQFDSGNLQRVELVAAEGEGEGEGGGGMLFELWMQPDTAAKRTQTWFHFSVGGTEGQKLRLRLMNHMQVGQRYGTRRACADRHATYGARLSHTHIHR